MRVLTEQNLAQSGRVQDDHVLFIGSALDFPDVMLRLVRIEFEGLGAARIDMLDLAGALHDIAGVRLVIVEERLAVALEHHYETLRERLGDTPVAFAYRDPAVARRLFALQREGRLEGLRFLPLDASLTGWVSMLRLLLAGSFVVPGDLIGPAAEPGRKPAPASQPPSDRALTQRELEVLDRVAQGHRNKIIAEALGVSEHTVKLHLHHIITKIGVDNRTAAANWYLARGGAGEGAGLQ